MTHDLVCSPVTFNSTAFADSKTPLILTGGFAGDSWATTLKHANCPIKAAMVATDSNRIVEFIETRGITLGTKYEREWNPNPPARSGLSKHPAHGSLALAPCLAKDLLGSQKQGRWARSSTPPAQRPLGTREDPQPANTTAIVPTTMLSFLSNRTSPQTHS